MVLAPTFREFCAAYKLTAKETRVASFLLQGMSSKQIAVQIRSTDQVVRNVLHSAYRKLDLTGAANNKRFRLLVMANDWVRTEKHRRIRARMEG